MSELTIEMLPPAALTAYQRNSRTHSPAQIKQLEASIKEFGFANPLLIAADNSIIAGHGRLAAARNLNLAAVPCIRLEHLTEAQRRAYIIAGNKLAENAGWDEELLRLELADLAELDFDLDQLGFKRDELDGILEGLDRLTGLTDEDATPPPPAAPTTHPGDLWILGPHRLLCGDATEPAAVARLLAGAKPHLMVTDPPYGVNYDASWRKEALGDSKAGRATGKVLNDHRADWREAWALFPGTVAYIWHAPPFTALVAESLAVCGLEVRTQIIWAKSQLVISRGHYHPQHEPCWYAVRKGATAHWQGSHKRSTLWRDIDDVLRDREGVFARREEAEIIYAISGAESTVWDIPKPSKSETGHSTQKPVACMRRPIQNNSRKGDAIYEPFSGSGTTIIAAEQTGRVCYALELNPAYVDVAVKRWEQFNGQIAQRCPPEVNPE